MEVEESFSFSPVNEVSLQTLIFQLNTIKNFFSISKNHYKDHHIQLFEKYLYLYGKTKLLIEQYYEKKKLIDEYVNLKQNLGKILKYKECFLSLFEQSKNKLSDKKFSLITTTEKNMIQSGLILGNRDYTASSNLNRIIENYKFNYEYFYPHEYGKIPKCSLYVNRNIKCDEPVFICSSNQCN